VLLAALDAVDEAEEPPILDVARDAVFVVADKAAEVICDELIADTAEAGWEEAEV